MNGQNDNSGYGADQQTPRQKQRKAGEIYAGQRRLAPG